MRLCAPGRPEPRFSASPFPLPALPPSGAQSCSGCAVEAQYVSIELDCCGRRLDAAAEPGSSRYRVEIYVLNGEAKSCSRPSKIKRGRYSHEAEVIDEGRPFSHRRYGPGKAQELGRTQAHPNSLYGPPTPLCPQEQSPHPLLIIPTQLKRPGSKGAELGLGMATVGRRWCLRVALRA